jgi:FAD/FMN-containing dehydrogenase
LHFEEVSLRPACLASLITHLFHPGGGGTFGVVIEATFKVEPLLPLQVTYLHWDGTNAALTRELWSIYVEHAVEWAEQGLGGVLLPNAVVFANPKLNSTQAAEVMQPLLAFGKRLTSTNVPGAAVLQTEFPSWLPFFNTFLAPHPAVSFLRPFYQECSS